MERRDVAALCKLRQTLMPTRGDRPREETQALFEWLYFSPHFTTEAPRAYVAVDGSTLIGHIGLTLSEWRRGHQRLNVVQPVNWVLDPNHRGMLGVSLMLKALSGAHVAATVGGTAIARQILPRLGFADRLRVGYFAKVLAPWQFLRTARSPAHLAKGVAKVGHGFATDAFRGLERLGQTNRCRVVEMPDPWRGEAKQTQAGTMEGMVLRNSLPAPFLKWYQACPVGEVCVLHCYVERRSIGTAVVMFRTSGRHKQASLLALDTWLDDESVWADLVAEINRFAAAKGATCINALATYAPLRGALKHQGYHLQTPLPLWVRDTSQSLADVNTWHITAIEGDNGYMLN